MPSRGRLSDEQRQRAGQAVSARRGELGWTQKDLADKARIGVDRISSLENAREWPQARNRAWIEAALGWPMGELQRIAVEGSAVDVSSELQAAYEAHERAQTALKESMEALEAASRRLRRRDG